MSTVNAVCVWDFTAPADKIDLAELKKLCKEYAKAWVFQLEEGAETKYKHYQGRVSLKVKSRAVRYGKENGIHWSPTSTENKANDFYVMKEDTRINGPWSDKDKEVYIPRQVRKIKELYPWQEYIIKDRFNWDTRTINIIFDKEGNKGKTTLKTYIGCHEIGRAIPFSNDFRDIMRMVMDTEKKSLYIIDIPRALKKDQLFQFFAGVEEIKNGYAFDDRYKFREEYFDCPNIWLFMNIIPERDYLSKDRWKVWEINPDFELVPYET